jgi:hypothetical protein
MSAKTMYTPTFFRERDTTQHVDAAILNYTFVSQYPHVSSALPSQFYNSASPFRNALQAQSVAQAARELFHERVRQAA